MKKQTILAVAAAMLTACAQNDIQELPSTGSSHLYVTTEQPETRIQLDDACRTVWTAGDEVSVFNYSTANERWRFDGQTGDTEGTLSKISGVIGHNLVSLYALYPYCTTNRRTENTTLSATIPIEQIYSVNSYDPATNLMIGSGNKDEISFKNLLGWLRLEIVGNNSVSKIMFQGNSNETLTGKFLIFPEKLTLKSAPDETDKSGVKLYLNCKESVALSETPTSFYFGVVPQTFSNGFTITIYGTDGSEMTVSTHKSISIRRNHIVPMSTITYLGDNTSIPDNEIWYTSSNESILDLKTRKSYRNNIVSHYYKDGKGVIEFEKDLTFIEDSIFMDCTSLTSMTLPHSIEKIGDRAFGWCYKLTSIDLKTKIQAIGNGAFCYCYNLIDFQMPESIQEIGYSAFSNCQRLKHIALPNSIFKIGQRAFENCYELDNIKLPKDITEIEFSVFSRCTNLKNIELPDNLVSIGSYAFERCALPEIIIPQSVNSIGSYAFADSGIENITLPDNLTSIESGTFSRCLHLKTITIPENITYIGESAFSGSGLTKITIPENVKSIGMYAFYDCQNLESVRVTNGSIGESAFALTTNLKNINIDGVTTIGASAFFNCGLSSIVIPSSVDAIDFRAFYSCDQLSEVIVVGSGNTYIGIDAFSKCNQLTSLIIGDGVASIGLRAFEYCISLKEVSLSNNLLSIAEKAFSGCKSIEQLTLGTNILSIGNRAFLNCSNLKEVFCKAPVPPILLGTECFTGTSIKNLYVPNDKLGAYHSASGWKDCFPNIIGTIFN